MEPVTLAEIKSFCKIDADYAADDGILNMFAGSARERLELHLNVGLMYREFTIEFDGSPLDLPFSPNGEIIEVTKNGEVITDYELQGTQAKKIWVNGACAITGDWYYSISGGYGTFTPHEGQSFNDVYRVKYNSGYQQLPQSLKLAILAETDYLRNNVGAPISDRISSMAKKLSQPWNRNLVI